MSRISYNSKTIDLWDVGFIQVVPRKPQTNRVTRTGVLQVLLEPRMDIAISAQWKLIDMSLWDEALLKRQFQNLWQWALLGNQFSLAIDPTKVIDTTLSADAAAGATTFTVTAPAGIQTDSIYRLIWKNNYQTVKVTNVTSNTVTISETLDGAFLAGAIFRDEWFFQCRLRDPNAPFPVIEREARNQAWFEITLNVFEAVA